MGNLMNLVSNNKTVSMVSGPALLESVSSFESKNGNTTIKLTFMKVGTVVEDKMGCDDVVKTTNIKAFVSSFKRTSYMFIHSKRTDLLEGVDEYYEPIEDVKIQIDSEQLFQNARSEKKDKIYLLEETLKAECVAMLEERQKTSTKKLTYTIDFSYEYDATNKSYIATFFTIEKGAKEKTINALVSAFEGLIDEVFNVQTKNEPVRGKEHLSNCTVQGYVSM